jgi:peptide/nickel transport system substrate-binding protein
VRHPIRALVISALAVSLAAAGCSRNEGSQSKSTEEFKQTKVILDTKGEAKTPAAEVDGAKKGGNITVFQDGDFEHLDPQQIYVSNSGAVAQQLIFRTLTTYVEDPEGGDLRLVGDLATNTGESSDDSKVWTFTLRDGIKFEDGTPITSKDIAYGIARSFSQFG